MAVSVRFPAAKAHATLRQVHSCQQAVEDHRYLSEYIANVQQSTALLRESDRAAAGFDGGISRGTSHRAFQS